MSAVVFMRAVNVGGTKTFRPSVIARELDGMGVINLGAAGTFVVPGAQSQAAIRAAFLAKLPFEAELMICRGREVLDLAGIDRFPGSEGLRRMVSVLSRRPATSPAFPVCQPQGKLWDVKVIGVHGRFALSLWRRLGKSFVDPNGVVEKAMGVRATTRNWNTIVKVRDALQGGSHERSQGRAGRP